MLLQYYKFRYNIPRASRQSQTLSEDCGKLGRRSSQNLPLSKAIDFSSSRFTADFATVHRKDILPYDLRFFSPLRHYRALPKRRTTKIWNIPTDLWCWARLFPWCGSLFSPLKQRKHMGDHWSSSIFKYISVSTALLHYWGKSDEKLNVAEGDRFTVHNELENINKLFHCHFHWFTCT